jgi:hypothetical protein
MKPGYTLVEILISVSLSLFLLLGVTHLFKTVGMSITDTQATLNMTRNLHWVAMTLRSDLANLTEDVSKPSRLNGPAPPGDNGYFEIIEGLNVPYVTGVYDTLYTPSTTHVPSTLVAKDSNTGLYDNTVGDVDDIIMFTARSPVESPFRGLVGGQMRESNTAEIVYFVRGNTLYRRVLLVADGTMSAPATGFYQNNDVSVRLDRDQTGAVVPPGTPTVVSNTLADLSRRENRYGHWMEYDSTWISDTTGAYSTSASYRHRNPFPHPIHYAQSGAATPPYDTRPWYYLRLPTLDETARPIWVAGYPLY